MKSIDLTEQEMEERIDALEEEVRELQNKVKELTKDIDSLKKKSTPSDQVDPVDYSNEDSWYTDHGHGD